MKLLLLSTPVGPFGSGVGGGVELTVSNLAQEMIRRGHRACVVAPSGSTADRFPIVAVPGRHHTFAQAETRQAPVCFPHDSVLAAMWDYAREVQDGYDLIVNFAYDWLPFYLTPFFRTPIAHFVSMGSLNDGMDATIRATALAYPHAIGVNTATQAQTFPGLEQARVLGGGIDLGLYEFRATPEDALAWVARIAPEKGLEDAAAAAARLGVEVRVLGKLQDEAYWQQVCQQYPTAKLIYEGFFPTAELQRRLGACRALLMTHKWVEAFGNVAIEALACGVPVVTYARGGPAEIVRDGETGFLVEPDSVDGLCAAIAAVPTLSRAACRQQAEAEFSLTALGDRFEAWFADLV